MFDEPVEHAVEWLFYNAFKAIGGPGAVEPRNPTGRTHALTQENQKLKEL